ncbi:MAG TPA: alpha/beta fold hydrolase [Gammaproteobacteria bacterium]|nr:alpha/beta fold hydrolase [Gammaproteobacteria bacterium]
MNYRHQHPPRSSTPLRDRAVALLICSLIIVPAGYSQNASVAQDPDADTASTPADQPRGLRRVFENRALRDALNIVRGIASQVVFQWGNAQDSRYGLFLDEDWQARTGGRPLVIIVHGFGSKPEEFDVAREQMREAGFGTAVFAYPNDAAIAFSARQFASALQEFERQYPDRRLSLVAHSMGGLVSRAVIEDPAIAAVSNIDQLIMIATPNHGSNLARVPVSRDVWENWLDGEPDTVKTVFFESVLDGLNEARIDLQPESEPLARLNSLSRSPDVRYSLLLGNNGPATREQLDELRRRIIASQDLNPALRVLGPRLAELLKDLDELVDGLGDGAVAVERGRLEGVDDTIVLSFNHGAITSALDDEDSRRLIAEVLARLDNEHVRTAVDAE